MFWKVCTSPNSKIPLRFRQLWHCTIKKCLRGRGQRYYRRLRMCVTLHTEQTQRSKNFRIQNENTERGAVIKGKGHNLSTKWKTGECYQWKATGSCPQGESCSFLPKPASGNREVTVENSRGSGLKPANERVRQGNEQTPKVRHGLT